MSLSDPMEPDPGGGCRSPVQRPIGRKQVTVLLAFKRETRVRCDSLAATLGCVSHTQEHPQTPGLEEQHHRWSCLWGARPEGLGGAEVTVGTETGRQHPGSCIPPPETTSPQGRQKGVTCVPNNWGHSRDITSMEWGWYWGLSQEARPWCPEGQCVQDVPCSGGPSQ